MTHPQYQPYRPEPTSGLAITSMVLGIVGLVIGWCLCGVPSLLAVVFGHVALPDINKTGKAGRGMAVAGLITGYIGIVPGIWLTLSFLASAGSTTP